MTAEIDLRNCKTKVVGLAEDTARRASVTELCQRLGLDYEIVDAVKCSPGHLGCGLSHLRVLRSTEALPLLLLEDDVAETEHYRPLVRAPEDADAIWLGASDFGAVPVANHAGFIHLLLAEEADEGLLRVHNLLSTHAVLYLTERFRRAAIESITRAVVDLGRPPDCGLAMIQSDFNVYAPRDLFFYQAAHLQAPGREQLEEWTRVTLRPSILGYRCLIDAPGEVREVVSVRTARGLEWTWTGAGVELTADGQYLVVNSSRDEVLAEEKS